MGTLKIAEDILSCSPTIRHIIKNRHFFYNRSVVESILKPRHRSGQAVVREADKRIFLLNKDFSNINSCNGFQHPKDL